MRKGLKNNEKEVRAILDSYNVPEGKAGRSQHVWKVWRGH